MSSVTPSTALTIRRERRNRGPPTSGKWTLKSLIEINGFIAWSITLVRLIRRRPRSRNDRANNDLKSVGRRAEIRAGKSLPHVHIVAQTDSPAVNAPNQAAARESDRARPVRLWDRARIA